MSQKLYEGTLNNFNGLTTVPVTVLTGNTSAVSLVPTLAGYKILSVLADNANTVVAAATAFSTTGTDAEKTLVGTDGEITVAQDVAHLADLVYNVTLLAPQSF